MAIPIPSFQDASLPSPPPSSLGVIISQLQPGQTQVQHWLVVIHYIYPLFLLFFFLGVLTWWGICTASKKPQAAWASPPITTRSSPARGRSPNSDLIDRNNISQGGRDLSGDGAGDEDRLLDIVTQGKLDGNSGRRWVGRLRARFAAWFRGDLEDHGDAQKRTYAEWEERKNKNVGLTPIRKALLSWGLVIVILSFIANSANIILHALVKAGWWCGQDVVVCFHCLLL